MKKTRQNLIVSIDNRLTGDPDCMSLKTTSNLDNIIIEFNEKTNKMNVNIADLQDSIDQINEFLKQRPSQPSIEQPLGVGQVNAIGDTLEVIEKQELDLSN